MGSPSGGTERITIRGSDTLVGLMQRWAERYGREHVGVELEVSGGGTGTGFAALLDRTTEVGMASRRITPQERADIERSGPLLERTVALDAVAIYVPEACFLWDTDLPTLKALFRGQVRCWRELGGPDSPVILYIRENSSGTYTFFKEQVLEKLDFAAEAQSLPGTAAVAQAVAQDANSIGFGGMVSAKGVRVLSLGGVAPNLEHAVSGRYPLARPLFVYMRQQARPAALAFVEWLTSVEAQRLAAAAG